MKYVYSFLLCFCFTSFFAQNRSFKIGDKYQGGTVVYLFKEGDSQYGKYEGIILADTVIKDQKWGCEGTQGIALDKLSTSSKIGSSLSNHELLLNNCKNGAASICNGLIIGNEKGWFLPTTEEINKIIENSSFLNKDIAPGKYWTNVDANINDAFILNIQNMGKIIYTLTTQKKYFPGIILPVKYFQKPVPVILKPEISFLNCTESKLNGSFPVGRKISSNQKVFFKPEDQYVKDLIVKVPYKGGNGVSYGSNVFKSEDTILKTQITLLPGKLNNGDGEFTFSINGATPCSDTVCFNVSFGSLQGKIIFYLKHELWMSKNLDVSNFRNGDTIFHAKNNADWMLAQRMQIPAWIYAGDDSTLVKDYGKLYNWFAVNDPRGLAPEGWHVASLDEWLDLSNSFGGNVNALKSKSGWWPISKNGSNESGFGAMPSGRRLMYKQDGLLLGSLGNWWTTNSDVFEKQDINYKTYSETYPISIEIDKKGEPFKQSYNSAYIGMSVRCVKD